MPPELRVVPPPTDDPRVPCHNLGAEAAVLSALLVDPAAAAKVVLLLTPDAFYAEAHRRICEAAFALFAVGQPTDIVTVATWLKDHGRLEQVGGPGQLTVILNAAPAVAHVEGYAEIVASKARVRRVQAVCAKLVAESYGPLGDENDWVDRAEGLIHEVGAARSRGLESRTMTEVAQSVYKQWEVASNNPSAPPTGLRTGLTVLDVATGGMHPGELWGIGARPAMGKAQPLDAGVLTPAGWREIGDLAVGDAVIGADGQSRRVLAVYERGPLDVFRVTMSDGGSTECCDEHLWLTRTRTDRRAGLPGAVRELKEIRRTISRAHSGGSNHSVPYASPARFESDLVRPLDAYLLGLWLGDGCGGQSSVVISNPESDLQKAVASLVPDGDIAWTAADGISIRIKRAVKNNLPSASEIALRGLGLSECRAADKFIPEGYLLAPVRERVRLLQGLCDTDGYVTEGGRSVEYVTVSKRLRDGVLFLVGGLGGYVTFTEMTPTYRYRGEMRTGQLAYRMILAFPTGTICPVSSEKHLSKWLGGRANKVAERFIAKVEPVGMRTCRCILVDAPDHLYVTDDFIVTHNTSLAIDIASYAVRRGAGSVIFSIEMRSEQLATRQLCSRAGVEVRKARSQAFDRGDWSKLLAAVEDERHAQHMHLVDMPCGLLEMRSLARMRAADMARVGVKLGVIVVDYVQLMLPAYPRQSREEAVSENARGLKRLSKELGCTVIMLSQLSREVEKRNDKRPTLADFKESGAIEESLDVGLSLYRHAYYHKGSKEPDDTEIGILKQKHGPPGIVHVGFDANATRFYNLAGDGGGGWQDQGDR